MLNNIKNKSSNRYLKMFVLVLAFILAIAMLCGFSATELNDYSSGDSSYVFTSKSQVISYLNSEYEDQENVSIVAGEETKLDTSNYSQTSLNSYYKTQTGVAVDGTCSEVATTSLIEFYKELDGFTTNDSYKDTFVEIMQIAIDEGYWTSGSGTSQTKLDSLVTKAFSLYGSANEGNNDYYTLYDTICEKVGDGKPVLFSIVGHTMVACGYVTYTISYKDSGTTQTETKNFVIVNDGWSSSRQYSYFPEDQISTNIFTRWDFCITKVV